MHIVIYLPSSFYAALAATMIEIIQAVNDVGTASISYEFVSHQKIAVSKSGVQFTARLTPSRKMDALIVLAGLESEPTATLAQLEREIASLKPITEQAKQDSARIAGFCGAAYLLAGNDLLNGKSATISWWLKQAAEERFPEVKWDTSKIIVQSGHIYTGGAAFSGIELITRLLIDMGFTTEESYVRKLLVLPPSREYQSPYEVPVKQYGNFEERLRNHVLKNLAESTPDTIARAMNMSTRTLARKSLQETGQSVGRWLQGLRLEVAKSLLQQTDLSVYSICQRIGYRDLASFSRLFSRSTGLAPGEFRKQL